MTKNNNYMEEDEASDITFMLMDIEYYGALSEEFVEVWSHCVKCDQSSLATVCPNWHIIGTREYYVRYTKEIAGL